MKFFFESKYTHILCFFNETYFLGFSSFGRGHGTNKEFETLNCLEKLLTKKKYARFSYGKIVLFPMCNDTFEHKGSFRNMIYTYSVLA